MQRQMLTVPSETGSEAEKPKMKEMQSRPIYQSRMQLPIKCTKCGAVTDDFNCFF